MMTNEVVVSVGVGMALDWGSVGGWLAFLSCIQ